MFTEAIVTLPPVGGKTIVLRWRLGASGLPSATGHSGWWIDSIRICDGAPCGASPVPERLDVDPAGNGVWEPGETVDVDPYYYNDRSGTIMDLVGVGTLIGPPGAYDYKLLGTTADYGSIDPGALGGCVFQGHCYSVQVSNPSERPAAHWDMQIAEELSTGPPVTWALHVGNSFADVASSNLFYRNIETVFHRGVTGGCGGANYCPDNPALRKQMAVFLLKSRFGSSYVPPAAVGVFADVPASDPFAPWIENLYNLGITGGCSTAPLNYCPDQTVLRKQMAVFLLKTLNGSAYVPPMCQGTFSDVACPSPFADWIEDLANRQIAAGCGNGNFCPGQPEHARPDGRVPGQDLRIDPLRAVIPSFLRRAGLRAGRFFEPLEELRPVGEAPDVSARRMLGAERLLQLRLSRAEIVAPCLALAPGELYFAESRLREPDEIGRRVLLDEGFRQRDRAARRRLGGLGVAVASSASASSTIAKKL